MAQTLSETSRMASHCGAETAPGPAATDSRKLIIEGILAWLPAIVILIGMPLVALTTTKYAIIPSMKRAYASQSGLPGNASQTHLVVANIPLSVSGGKSAHSGFRSVGLVGTDSAFKSKIDQNKAKLMAVAASGLKGKTIADLDKPGELDAMRAKLLADCNRALGGPVVKDLYIAVWP